MKSALFKEIPNYPEEGTSYVLNISELNDLRNYEGYTFDSKTKTHIKIEHTPKDILDIFQRFCEWFIVYSDDITKGRILPVDKIADVVFNVGDLTLKAFKDFLFKSLHIATDYIKYLRDTITEDNIHRYKTSITDVYIDYEWLINRIECYYKGLGEIGDKIRFLSNRRMISNTMDMRNAIGQLFFIERIDKIEDLDTRDIKPLFIFQVRQLLEVFGKGIIGFDKIEDEKGDDIQRLTQIAWEFLKKQSLKGEWSIEFPCQFSSILKLNKWANGFVHTTYSYTCYVQYFAIKFVEQLFRVPTDNILCYDNRVHSNFLFGDVRIYKYEALKNDFEKFIKENKKMPNINICWSELKYVHAYIISL